MLSGIRELQPEVIGLKREIWKERRKIIEINQKRERKKVCS